MNDPAGHPLIPASRRNDPLRHRPVWAAYKLCKGASIAASRQSAFLAMVDAKAVADALNLNRVAGDRWYFSVFRLSTPTAEA